MNNLVELFCDIDDFYHQFIPQWETQLITDETRKQKCSSAMSFDERITIMISFHHSNHRDFKNFYIGLIQRYWTEYFPSLISYTHFINTICAYFQTTNRDCIYIIETVNDQLRSISQIEPSRHRSETGFMLNVISGIVSIA